MLARLIDSHPQAGCRGELLKKGDRPPEEAFQHIFSPKWKFIKALGIKLHYHQPMGKFHQATWEYLKQDTSIKIIHLHRKNILRCHVSDQVSQKLKKYTAKTQSDIPSLTERRVVLDLDEIENLDVHYKARHNLYAQMFSSHSVLDVAYEDLVNQLPEESEKLCDFLLLKRQLLKQKSPIFNPEPLSEIVENYDELVATVKSTSMEWMLDEQR